MPNDNPGLTRRTRTPRTGRRPGSSNTREAILTAAQRHFAERGYEGTSLRAIAESAGVDAALIVHFFGSKAKLLNAASEWPFDPEEALHALLTSGTEHVGEQLASLFVRTWDNEGARNPLIILLRTATNEPGAAELLTQFLRTQLLDPLLNALGSDQPAIRGNLVASQIVGLGLARYLLHLEPLASARPRQVVTWVAPTLQHYLTGSL